MLEKLRQTGKKEKRETEKRSRLTTHTKGKWKQRACEERVCMCVCGKCDIFKYLRTRLKVQVIGVLVIG